jgi:hypothetical protein
VTREERGSFRSDSERTGPPVGGCHTRAGAPAPASPRRPTACTHHSRPGLYPSSACPPPLPFHPGPGPTGTRGYHLTLAAATAPARPAVAGAAPCAAAPRCRRGRLLPVCSASPWYLPSGSFPGRVPVSSSGTGFRSSTSPPASRWSSESLHPFASRAAVAVGSRSRLMSELAPPVTIMMCAGRRSLSRDARGLSHDSDDRGPRLLRLLLLTMR